MEEKLKKGSEESIGAIHIRFFEKDKEAWELWKAIPKGNRRATFLRMLLEYHYGLEPMVYDSVKRALADTFGNKLDSICFSNPTDIDTLESDAETEEAHTIPPEMLAFCLELNGL